MAYKKQSRPHLLSSTRPRNIKSPPTLSSQATRTLVRTHHTLRKQLSSALAAGSDVKAKELQAQIDAAGGLAGYQQASIQGQSAQRGGDTSRVLMEWLSKSTSMSASNQEAGSKLRMLEVGSLKTDNACSKSRLFDMTRIDLNSQHPLIRQQDFMDIRTPSAAELGQEGFDIVSLSLVVNFVSSPKERGEMLRRVQAFLRPSRQTRVEALPVLFLVLPVACVNNSRYLDEDKLEAIMESLGYKKVQRRMSAKLVYYLWRLETVSQAKSKSFKKQELKAGKSRNNFAITLP